MPKGVVEYDETAMFCLAARLPVDLSEFFIVRKVVVIVSRPGLLPRTFAVIAKPESPRCCIRVPTGTQQASVDPCQLLNFAMEENVGEQAIEKAC